MTDMIFVFYTPNRSTPRNMPAVLKVAGWGNETLHPGENYCAPETPNEPGNKVSVKLASLLIDQHPHVVSLRDESDLLKIKAFREAENKTKEMKTGSQKEERKAKKAAERARMAAILAGEIRPGQELQEATADPEPSEEEIEKDGE